MALAVGDHAPDFTLADQDRQPVRLSDQLDDQVVVLIFYPFAFSSICSDELCTIRDRRDFTRDGVQVMAVSVDSPQVLKAWADARDLPYPLLSDFWPHGAVASAYDVFDDVVGAARRGTFVIDSAGVIRYAVDNDLGDPRDDQPVVDVLDRLLGGA